MEHVVNNTHLNRKRVYRLQMPRMGGPCYQSELQDEVKLSMPDTLDGLSKSVSRTAKETSGGG